MMSKFWFLVGNSFNKKAKSKWFVVVNIILLIAVVGIINIDSIIKMFGGDFNNTYEIVIKDNTNYSSEIFKTNIEALNKELELDYKLKITDDIKINQEEIKNTDKVLVEISENTVSFIDAKVISNGYIDTAYYQLLYQALSNTKDSIALSLSTIDQSELMKLKAPISIERVLLDDEKTSVDEQMSMIMGTVFPTVILPFFMLVVFLVQMIGAEINEEKQTRSMEVIISNVSPKVHFFSKMLASNLFVIMQGLLFIGYGLLGLVIKNNIGAESASGLTEQISSLWGTLTANGFADKLIYIIPLTLILMILSFITYSLLAGILASMTVNMEDFQHVQTPLMMVLLVGYYLAIMAGMFEGSIFIRVISYVPLISCILSPALLVIGQIGITDVVVSIILAVLLNVVLVKYGLKIYKIGILNYSTDKMWSKILNAAKQKD